MRLSILHTFTSIDIISESIQTLRQNYLNGAHQVIHAGRIGWFDVYSIEKVDNFQKNELTRYFADAGIPRANAYEYADKWLKQIHNIEEYDGGSRQWVADHGLSPDVINNIQETTDRLRMLGFKRMKQLLILANLAGIKNPITGGEIGGRAYLKTHGIVVDKSLMFGDDAIRILAHEWAHQYWKQLSKEKKKTLRVWFNQNISVEARRETKIDVDTRSRAIHIAWKAFQKYLDDFYKKLDNKSFAEYLKSEKVTFGRWSETKLSTFYKATDVARNSAYNYVVKNGYPYISIGDFIPFSWPDQLSRDIGMTQNIDEIENQFRLSLGKHADWGLEVQLETPAASKLRQTLHSRGIVPTAYAAANQQELWSELVGVAASNTKVRKSLKPLFNSMTESIEEDIPYWEAEWLKWKNLDVLQIPGSRWIALPVTGRKNARIFQIVDTKNPSGEGTQLRRDEVHGWLVRMARDEGLRPTGTIKD